MRRTGRRGGFTLLELTISMTLLALVVGICYAAFHLGMRAMERDRKSTRLNSSHIQKSRMPSSA